MKPTPIRTAALVLFLLSLLSVTGCGAPGLRPAAEPAGADRAQQAEKESAFVLAAGEYERLAQDATAPQRQHYELKRVETLIKAGQIREARQGIAAVNIAGLDPGFRSRKLLLEAYIVSSERHPEQALDLLRQAEQTRNLDPALYAEIHQARAQAELALDRPLSAAKSLVLREKYLVRKNDIDENQQQLWHILETQSPTGLQRELAVSRDPVLSGWLDLALKAIDYGAHPDRLAQAIEGWRKTYPDHPAGDLFLKTLASPAPGVRVTGGLRRIALLLPLSSEHVQAAQAVRDGFLAMHGAGRSALKPEVKVYDIGPDPALAPNHYARAAADGVQFIVGPLGLEAVDQVARRSGLEVPTLLLSHTSQNIGAYARHVFQFGLPPEQEAIQAAERAYLDGHRRAAVLSQAGAWGQRVAGAFTAAWERLGGLTVTAQNYLPDQAEYSTPVRRLLNIHLSEARKEALEARIKTKVKYEPRPREDIDFIFLAADPKHARLIKPQINYHRAARVPVYATSHVFSGHGDPVADADLDGVRFGDMPWMLASDARIEELRANLQGAWPYAHSPLDRLYALGMDAYSVIPHLHRLSADQTARFGGVTSGLSIDRDGHLHRQLLWARFKKGVPQLLDTFFQYKGQFETDDGAEEPLVPGSGT